MFLLSFQDYSRTCAGLAVLLLHPHVFLALLGIKGGELLLALCPMRFSLSFPIEKWSNKSAVTIQSIFSYCLSFLEGMHASTHLLSFPSPSLPSDPSLLVCEVPLTSSAGAYLYQFSVHRKGQILQQKHRHRKNTGVKTSYLFPLQKHV